MGYMQFLLHTCTLIHAFILASIQFLSDTCISYWKHAAFIGHMHFVLVTGCAYWSHVWGMASWKIGFVRTWWGRRRLTWGTCSQYPEFEKWGALRLLGGRCYVWRIQSCNNNRVQLAVFTCLIIMGRNRLIDVLISRLSKYSWGNGTWQLIHK